MPRAPTIGKPGTAYTNDTGKVQYQFLCDWSNTCGLCAQFDHVLSGVVWPIPLHRFCRCTQISIFPGNQSLPFTDFRSKIDELSDAQRARVLGGATLKLVESGMVKWSDVVTGNQIRTLAEVAAKKKLSVEDLVKAGVRKDLAEKAALTVGLSGRALAAARRERTAERLARAAAARARLVAQGEAVAATRAGAQFTRERVVTRGGATVRRRADYLKSAGVKPEVADRIARGEAAAREA